MLLQLTAGLSARGHDLRTLIGEPGWLLDRLVEKGVSARVVPMGGLGLVCRIPSLRGEIDSFRPDLILSHGARANFLGTAAAALRRVPAVSVEHSMDSWRRPGSMLARVDRLIAKRNRGRIAVSQAIADMLAGQGVLPAGRLEVIPNGVDFSEDQASPDRTRMRARFGFSPDDTILVVVARLVRLKGHLFLLEAMARLKADRPGLRCLLLGDGPMRAELETRVRQLGLASDVVFAGEIDDVLDVLPACDIFVLPSLWEGMPVAVIEAMGAGLPVVATKVSGTPEVVVDGVTGLLVPPNDAAALAVAVAGVIDDPATRFRLAAAGRHHARAAFSFDGVLDRYEEVLNRWSLA